MASGKPHNEISCSPFSEKYFREIVRRASLATDSMPSNRQTEYLARHLKTLGTKTIIVESHYIDRHYMEEVSFYYSSCLIPRPNHCTRIHLFSGPDELTEDRLDQELQDAARGNHEAVSGRLSQSYLGFVVVRPIPSVPVGRTVLAVPIDKSDRCYTALANYTVHLLGLELTVLGLAFQQQDRAVAACATTAIWSALQRMCRHEGARTPTPSEITQAAVKSPLTEGRPFPSVGLHPLQVCDALNHFNFAPVFFSAAADPTTFQHEMHIYLKSGIPVILALGALGGGPGAVGHAVTVVGYREKRVDTKYELSVLKNLDFDQIYVHDDRTGPYARARLRIAPNTNGLTSETTADRPLLILLIERDGLDEPDDEWIVEAGIAPLYPKLRSNGSDLYRFGSAFIPMVDRYFGQNGDGIGIEVFFQRSGEYLGSLYTYGLDADRLIRFQKTIALSRYVGIVRWSVGNKFVLDGIWDTTDRLREEQFAEHMLGLVAVNATDAEQGIVDQLAADLNVVAG